MLPVIRNFERNLEPLWYRSGPWYGLGRLFDECWCDSLIGSRNFGNLDLYEDDESVHVEVELPGWKREDVELTMEEGVLHIEAHRNEKKQDRNANYHVRERRSGRWTRSIQLPTTVNEEKIEAAFKDGILKISLAKQAKSKAHKIEVK